MMSDTPEIADLAACPHCEAPGYFVWNRTQSRGSVKCTRPSCGATGGAFERRQDAIAAWNTRPTPPKVAGDAEEIAAELDRHALSTRRRGAGEFHAKLLDRAAAHIRATASLAVEIEALREQWGKSTTAADVLFGAMNRRALAAERKLEAAEAVIQSCVDRLETEYGHQGLTEEARTFLAAMNTGADDAESRA